jgi:hypothetical protein
MEKPQLESLFFSGSLRSHEGPQWRDRMTAEFSMPAWSDRLAAQAQVRPMEADRRIDESPGIWAIYRVPLEGSKIRKKAI